MSSTVCISYYVRRRGSRRGNPRLPLRVAINARRDACGGSVSLASHFTYWGRYKRCRTAIRADMESKHWITGPYDLGSRARLGYILQRLNTSGGTLVYELLHLYRWIASSAGTYGS